MIKEKLYHFQKSLLSIVFILSAFLGFGNDIIDYSARLSALKFEKQFSIDNGHDRLKHNLTIETPTDENSPVKEEEEKKGEREENTNEKESEERDQHQNNKSLNSSSINLGALLNSNFISSNALNRIIDLSRVSVLPIYIELHSWKHFLV